VGHTDARGHPTRPEAAPGGELTEGTAIFLSQGGPPGLQRVLSVLEEEADAHPSTGLRCGGLNKRDIFIFCLWASLSRGAAPHVSGLDGGAEVQAVVRRSERAIEPITFGRNLAGTIGSEQPGAVERAPAAGAKSL
jgi:hypothetical protein